MRQYWQFYWPLALTGMAMVLSIQFQNATLARFSEATTEIAIMALAYGVYGFFNACLQFNAQLTNVYARSPGGTRRTRRFVLVSSVVLAVPLLAIANTTPGEAFVQSVFGLSPEIGARVSEYLTYMTPLVLLNAQRHLHIGLLVQARLTLWVTALNFVYLGTVIVGLIAGFTAGWSPPVVLVGAEIAGVCTHLVLLIWVVRIRYVPPAVTEHDNVTYGELTRFFIPVSMTGVMFALSRPVIFAFVARTEQGIVTIAALRVAFDFTALFQQAANQFRHFFITFGFQDDLPRKRAFMALMWLGLTTMMLAMAATPLSDLIWRDAMRLPDDVRTLAVQSLLVMCLMPTTIILRNYFHGRLMTSRRTNGMAAAGIVRVMVIYGLCQVLFAMGWLNHITAAAVLIAGFAVETGVSLMASARLPAIALPVSQQTD